MSTFVDSITKIESDSSELSIKEEIRTSVPRIPSESNYRLALKDIFQGIKAWRIWMFLAWQDVCIRYRRSYLGTFWITVNMTFTVTVIGFLYGRLLGEDLKFYYPQLAAGLLLWNLTSACITDSVSAFLKSQDYIRQIRLPYFVYVLRVIAKNFFIFLYHFLVFIPVMVMFQVEFTFATLLVFPCLLLILCLGLIYAVLLGLVGARFPDLRYMINNLVHAIFFVTPVLWPTGRLPERFQYLMKFNPFAQVIELVRNPMLGKMPSLFAVGEVMGFLLLGMVVMFWAFAQKRKQIIYWL